MKRRLRQIFAGGPLLLAAFFFPAGPAGAQVYAPVIDLEKDAPEAWALRYFTAASLFGGAGPAESKAPGKVELGLETIWVPSLDREQRTVGYGGLKEEELNRSPVWARLRAAIGLPGGFVAEVGYIPPLEIDGVKANLVAAAIARRIYQSGDFALGLRVHAQRGKAKGDFTCKEGQDHLFPPGSPQNEFGCNAPSRDEVRLDSTGVELAAGYRLQSGPRLHAAIGWSRMDVEFQVDAQTFGFRDRTLLKNEGDAITFAAGAIFDLDSRASLALEAAYTPLDITRPGKTQENDPLLHAKAVLRVPLR